MLSYTIRRLLLVIPTVFLALSFLFLLFFALPGDPANLIAGGGGRTPDPGVVERIEERYGLNDSLATQFKDYWVRTVQWDLGESFSDRRSVNDILGEKAVNSMRLAFWAVLIEIVVGISVGVLSAVRRYSLADKLTTVGTAALSAVPVFVLGFILQYVFAVYPNKQGWPDWTKLRTQGLGPDT
ncbi:MAG: ABC transporter permease, partial [Acidimicrobiales bacterium]